MERLRKNEQRVIGMSGSIQIGIKSGL